MNTLSHVEKENDHAIFSTRTAHLPAKHQHDSEDYSDILHRMLLQFWLCGTLQPFQSIFCSLSSKGAARKLLCKQMASDWRYWQLSQGCRHKSIAGTPEMSIHKENMSLEVNWRVSIIYKNSSTSKKISPAAILQSLQHHNCEKIK